METGECGDTSAGLLRSICRICWIEPGDARARSVHGRIIGHGSGFLDIELVNGRFLRIAESCVLKIETEESGKCHP